MILLTKITIKDCHIFLGFDDAVVTGIEAFLRVMEKIQIENVLLTLLVLTNKPNNEKTNGEISLEYGIIIITGNPHSSELKLDDVTVCATLVETYSTLCYQETVKM